jgi:ubiquinone/menaquinone biosynthesis C-methylase UbiE
MPPADVKDAVIRHYGRGGILQRLLDACAAAGADPEHLDPEVLSAADEFHLGGVAATTVVIGSLDLDADDHVLDVGSGIGGPARTMARTTGCRVTGVDLTPEFVEAATELSRRCGMADHTTFRVADATALPFAGADFTAATMFHVGMNIERKDAVFAEVARVLRPGARFAVYDLMRVGEDDIAYPEPWAATPETSFVRSPDEYATLLESAGFTVERTADRRELALEALARARADPAPVNVMHVVGTEQAPAFANVAAMVQRGVLAPLEILSRR